jgi:hypothetical protein
MSVKVRIKDIIDGMEMQIDDWQTFLNVKTGVVVQVTDEDLRAAEDEEPYDDLLDWQKENREIAEDVVTNFDDYERLPDSFDINEYAMMEQFCYTVKKEEHTDQLLDAIRGKGAFRRFKDKVNWLGIEEDWYAYRDTCYTEQAKRWCEDVGVEYLEE